MKNTFLIAVILCLSACCADKACRLDKRLDELPDQEAFSRFRELDAQDQVDVYVWELTHSKPVASRYEFLLRENASAVAKPLLDAANRSEGYIVQASILRSLAKLPQESRLDLARSELEAAVKRCKSLAGNEHDEICVTYGGVLLR